MTATRREWTWGTIATPAELDAYHALTASLDPRFAASEIAFYQARTAPELRVLASQAWHANIRCAHVLAKSYLAKLEAVS